MDLILKGIICNILNLYHIYILESYVFQLLFQQILVTFMGNPNCSIVSPVTMWGKRGSPAFKRH